MEETRIGFSGAEKRSMLIRLALLVVFTGTISGFLDLRAASTHAALWYWPGLFGVVLLPCVGWGINRAWGVTVLTPEGLELRSLTRRRRVPWGDVDQLESLRRTGRGGSWRVARIHRVDGRPLVLPGLILIPGGWAPGAFADRMEQIRAYWQGATGRDQAVLITE